MVKMLYAGLLIYLLQWSCQFGLAQEYQIFAVDISSRPQNQPSYQTPQSPCPKNFQYQYNSGVWTGLVSISPPSGLVLRRGTMTPIKLELLLVVPATLPSKYIGKVELIGSSETVLQQLRNGQPISYRVYFPLTSPLPYLTLITVNGKAICVGNLDRRPSQPYTVITLNHSFLPYSIPLGGGSISGGDNYNPGQEVETNFGSMPPQGEVNQKPVDSFLQQPNREPTRPPVYVDHTTSTTPAYISTPSTTIKPVTQKPISTTPSQEQQNVCGKPLTGNFLVVNGDPVTKRGEWPWMVAIFQNINDGVGIKFYCGATLISKYYVLTAAHCTKSGDEELPATKFTLYLGKFNLNKWTEQGAQTRDVKNIYINPSYDSTADSDIAVMELSIAAEYGPYIQPVCMWPSSSSDLTPIIGKIGTVVGWGLDENNKISSSVPKTAKLPIVSQEECLRSEPSFTYFTSTKTFCAGFRNGTGPCNGDSGGGFVMPMPDEGSGGVKWFLRGVVSTSLKTTGTILCDLKNYVIFTDIAKHRSWLSQFGV